MQANCVYKNFDIICVVCMKYRKKLLFEIDKIEFFKQVVLGDRQEILVLSLMQ